MGTTVRKTSVATGYNWLLRSDRLMIKSCWKPSIGAAQEGRETYWKTVYNNLEYF